MPGNGFSIFYLEILNKNGLKNESHLIELIILPLKLFLWWSIGEILII